MSPRRHDLDVRFRWIPLSVVAVFSAAFAVGLILYTLDPEGPAAITAINAGLLLLIASPAARLALATAERIRRRDWSFLAMAMVIAIELLIVLWRASVQT